MSRKKLLGVLAAVIVLMYLFHPDEPVPQKIIRNTVEVLGDRGLGSGTIIRSDDSGSLVLTNKHVCNINKVPLFIEGLVEIVSHPMVARFTPFRIFASGSRTPEEGIVLSVSENTDLCVISVPGLKNHSTVKLASSQGRIGDTIYTTGFPLGVPLMTSTGFLGERITLDNESYQMISLLIYPGSSGSGVFNERGELVGVVAIGVNGAPSISGAIPLNDVLNMVNKFLK